MIKILKWLAFGFFGLIALGMVIEANKTPEQKAADAAAQAEQQVQQQQQATDQARQEMAALPTITANALAKAYHNNTVAADQQYKGKKFKVSGVIADISTGFSGEPYITLRSGVNSFMEPQFQFGDDASTEAIAKLKKGNKITLICVGGGDIAKTPMSNDCLIR
jgi:hypothetical protein